MAALTAFSWPGNVRQLENAVYRAVVISDTGALGTADFPLLANAAEAALMPSPALALDMPAELRPMQPAMIEQDIPIAPAAPGAMLNLLTADGETRPLEEIETEVIRFAIAHYRGQMSEVARRLKIGRSTLYRKLEAMDDRPTEPATGD
jgi:DNA-binding NtrC family response regulator